MVYILIIAWTSNLSITFCLQYLPYYSKNVDSLLQVNCLKFTNKIRLNVPPAPQAKNLKIGTIQCQRAFPSSKSKPPWKMLPPAIQTKRLPLNPANFDISFIFQTKNG